MPNGGDDVNRRSLRVDAKDVYGKTVTHQAEIAFFNQRARSLSQQFNVHFSGSPVFLPAPAFPFGAARQSRDSDILSKYRSRLQTRVVET